MKQHHGTGGYIGTSGSYTTGGAFSLKEAQILKSNSAWGLDIITDGLQLYLDASSAASYSGSGTQWNDLSGNGRHFTWASTPSFNSTGVKYFSPLNNAANGPASNSFGVTNTSGYTILMTMYQNANSYNHAFKWYSSNGTGSASRGFASHCTWPDNVVYWDQGGCCATDTRTSFSLSSAIGTWHVIVYRCNYSGTSRTIWDGTTLLTTNSSAIANINLNSTAAQIGSSDEYGGNASNWNARIGQFVLYNRSLSDTELTATVNVLKAKVGL